MKQHYCSTSDGMKIVCFCLHEVNHDESEFDIPPKTGELNE